MLKSFGLEFYKCSAQHWQLRLEFKALVFSIRFLISIQPLPLIRKAEIKEGEGVNKR